MVKKIALFTFNGEMMCFIHALLNALDMNEKGYDVKIIIEGSSTKLIKNFHEEGEKNNFYKWYKNVKEQDLIHAVCKACSMKMGAIEAVKAEGLPLVETLDGHPAISTYVDDKYNIITF
ncbi:MAG: DsrE family protein [Promethearchaeota archaeon]